MAGAKKANEEEVPQSAFHAGFPNPALDAVDIPLDLNKLVVKNRASTFYMRVDGTSWEEMEIYSGDILTIDRALTMRPGDVFIGVDNGEFVLRQQPKTKKASKTEVEVWGVVTHIIHEVRSKA